MASHASKAAARLQQDRSGRPDHLKVVKDDKDDTPAPPAMTKGDLARKAARDALEPHQQAVYDQIMAGGGRHVTALAKARAAAASPEPAPADPASDLNAAAADMFAAFAAMQQAGGSADQGQGLLKAAQAGAAARAGGDAQPEPKKDKPKPAPKQQAPAAPPKPARPRTPAPAPKPSPDATCTLDAVPFDRFIGIVTAAGKDHDCEHGARNGHIEESTALACAGRLLRNYAGGQPGTRIRYRYNGAYTPAADGARQVLCGCRFGHKEEAAAVACARGKAAAAGLTA